MSDDLVKMCKRLSKHAHAQLSSTDLESIANRIEELEAKLAKAISAFEQIEAGVVPETDPDTGIWIECNMSEDEMQEIARTTLAELKEDN